MKLGAQEGWDVSAPLGIPVVLGLLQARWWVMNKARTALWLRLMSSTSAIFKGKKKHANNEFHELNL